MQAFNIYIILVLANLSLIAANYEYICSEEVLHRPYLKIYETRQGPLIHDHPPGFYDVSQLNNIYVCTNGPVVFYFTRHTIAGDVFDEARNAIDIHKCQYYNGLPNDLSKTKTPDHLKAILLMGDERDYTLPFVKTFTAPLLINDTAGIYINVTSVMTIGAQNCKIYKGPTRQEINFDIAQLSDSYESETKMCRLSYLKLQDDPTTTPDWVHTTSVINSKSLKDLLKNDNGVKEGECDKHLNINPKTIKEFEEKKNNATDLQTSFTTFKGTITVPTKPTDADIQNKMDEITTKKTAIEAETDPAKKATFQNELKDLEVDLSFMKAERMFSDIYDRADLAQGNFTKFSDAKTILDGLTSALSALELAENDKKEQQAIYEGLDPSDAVKIKEVFDKYKQYSADAAAEQDKIDTASITALPLITEAETKYKALQLLMKLLPLAKIEYDKALKAKTDKVIFVSDTLAKLEEESTHLPTTVTVDIDDTKAGTLPAPPPEDATCIDFPTVGETKYRPTTKGTCMNEKGTKLWGCQLLKARLGEPGICALKEEEADNDDDSTKFVPDARPITDFLPQHMVDVLELINKIYGKACTRIRNVFAPRINNMLLCYLIRDRVNKNLTAPDVPSPNVLTTWNLIIDALKECLNDNHELKFAKESYDVNKYYLKKDDDDYVEVPFLKEQAENEFGFNFALDMAWKIFSTVHGICMPSIQSKIAHIDDKFLTRFTEEFLQPIAAEWTSEKDNNIHKRIMSYYFGAGGSETWASYCMEAAYLYYPDGEMRPPRDLQVTDHAEKNYFLTPTTKYLGRKKK